MNKKEAADYLGCSVRAIERYTQQGKISVRYEKGKTSNVANFDEEELERFKQQLEESLIKPAILEPRQISPESQSKLAILNDDAGEVVGVDDIDRMSSIIEMLLQVQSVRIAEKVLLTITEAQALTGLSREILRDAIATGSLKSKKIGKPWRIKRTDLDTFIENL
jgi:excisionase family DNA binding protein